MKLELKHLAAYLPYGFTFKSEMDKPFDEVGINPIWTAEGAIKMFGDYCLTTKDNNDAYSLKTCKPILRPLSQLTQEIEHNGEKFVPIVELAKIHVDYGKNDSNLKVDYTFSRQDNVSITWNHASCTEPLLSDDLFIMTERIEQNRFWVIQKLLEWHFDIFGLIENNLAIEKL